MPTAVLVGTDACALHVGGQLQRRGFDVTLLESTQFIGGQWVQRLLAEKAERTFAEAENAVFLDFPLLSNRAQPTRRLTGALETQDQFASATEAASPAARAGSKTAWMDAQGGTAGAASLDQQLLRHMADYAHAAGLHRNVRLGCTLRRAKWQAMNGCWRLELKYEAGAQPQQQKMRSQLSADLLVVSKMAVASARLPYIPGTELYCGTVLTVNDQLTGPGGEAVLREQLRGRNVLVVGPPGGVAGEWAEACRRHAGAGGTVVLLEVEDDRQGRNGAEALDARDSGDSALSRLLGACFGRGAGGAAASASRSGSPDNSRSGRHARAQGLTDTFSPAEPPDPVPEDQGDVTMLEGAEGPASGTITPDEVEGDVDGEGDGVGPPDGVVLDPGLGASVDVRALKVAGGTEGVKRQTLSTPTAAAAVATAGGVSGGAGAAAEAKGAKGALGGEGRQQPNRGGSGGVGGDAPRPSAAEERLTGGRSSLRALRGVSALLNGHYVTLGTGEEIPAEVVLLVPMGGTEVGLAFLDAGAPVRASQAGGGASSVGGSFRRLATGASMNGSISASGAAANEPLSRQLDELYRDMLSGSPIAPNLALVGMGTEAGLHDPRVAALQASWILATWAVPGVNGSTGGEGGGGGGAGADFGGGGLGVGFLRQASPVEAAADRALRAQWQREAARRGRQEVYLERYLEQLMRDLGVAPQAPSKCGCVGGRGRGRGRSSSSPTTTSDLLSRPAVTKLLGLKRLLPVRQSCEAPADDRLSLGHSPRASPHSIVRTRGYSCNGSGAFAIGYGSTGGGNVAAAIYDRPSTPGSRDASMRYSNSAAALLRARIAGGSGVGGGSFDVPLRSDGSSSAALGFGAGLTAGGLLVQQQSSPATMMVSRGSATSISRATLNNMLVGHDQQLYRVAEHPSEYPVGAPASATGRGGDVGDDVGGGSGADAAVAASCPSSPALPPPAGMAGGAGGLYTTGSMSGSGARSRLLLQAGSHAGSFAMPNTGGGGGGAGAANTSPLSGVGLGSGGSGGMGGAEDGGTQQQRLRAQLLTRHRSQSRLAGVSNASTAGPATNPALVSTSFIGLAFGRRPAAVSTSQVSFDASTSAFMNERRSQSGRPSNSTRRRPQAQSSSNNIYSMAGGGGGGGGGSQALLGRVNSAARLQLLLAAASSASRKRQNSGAVQSLPPDSPEPYGSGVGGPPDSGGGGGVAGGLQKAYSEALQPLRVGPDGALYSGRYGSLGHLGGGGDGSIGSVGAGGLQGMMRPSGAGGRVSNSGAGAVGGRTSGMGASVTALARSARASGAGVAAGGVLGSVSEPVRPEDLVMQDGDGMSVGPAMQHADGRVYHHSSQPPRPSQYGKAASGNLAAGKYDDTVAEVYGSGAGGAGRAPPARGPSEAWVAENAGDAPGDPGAPMSPPGIAADPEDAYGETASPGVLPARPGTGRVRGARRRSITLPDLRFSAQLQQLMDYGEGLAHEEEDDLEGEGVVMARGASRNGGGEAQAR